MDYPTEMYDEQLRKLAKWKYDDAMQAMSNAVITARIGDYRASERYTASASKCLADAEYYEKQL